MCEDLDISLIISVISLVVSVITTFIALKYTRTQLLLSIAPELWSNTVNYKSTNNEITFGISNRGHIARIYKIKIKKGEINHHSASFPYDLNTNEDMNLYFSYVGKGNMQQNEYKIEICYKDKKNNKQSVILSCKGSKVHIK